jgi:hypothetical protein
MFIYFSLLNKLLEATWLIDQMTVDLTAQQDENASRDGEDRQKNTNTTTKKLYYAPDNKKDGQQDHAYAFSEGEFQSCTPFLGEGMVGAGSGDPCRLPRGALIIML